MRFVAVLQWNERGDEKMTVVPPCEGYYTNLSMQLYTSMDPNDEAFRLYMGTELNEDIFDQNPDTGGDRQISGSYMSNKGVYLKFPAIEDAGGTAYNLYWKHFGKQRIYINKGEVLHIMGWEPAGAGTFPTLLIQGNFIPKRGAVLHQKFESTLDETDDFGTQASTATQNANIYRFQHDLANVQVKITITTTWATNNYEGIAYFKRQKRGQDWFADTIADGRGDILDTNYIDQKYASLHGIIGSVPFHTAASGPTGTESARTLTFEKVLSVGSVREGDFLSWDIEDIGADTTMNGTFYLNLEIAGVIAKKHYCKEGDFLSAPEVMVDLNTIDIDVEMA